MRLSLSVLGTEVFAFEVSYPADFQQEAAEPGPPFGFSGGAGGCFEQAYPDLDDALPTPRRVD